MILTCEGLLQPHDSMAPAPPAHIPLRHGSATPAARSASGGPAAATAVPPGAQRAAAPRRSGCCLPRQRPSGEAAHAPLYPGDAGTAAHGGSRMAGCLAAAWVWIAAVFGCCVLSTLRCNTCHVPRRDTCVQCGVVGSVLNCALFSAH